MQGSKNRIDSCPFPNFRFPEAAQAPQNPILQRFSIQSTQECTTGLAGGESSMGSRGPSPVSVVIRFIVATIIRTPPISRYTPPPTHTQTHTHTDST